MSDLLTNRDGTLEPISEHRCRYTTWVDSFEWLAVSTAILDVDFHIEEPAGFVEYSVHPGQAAQPRRDSPLM